MSELFGEHIREAISILCEKEKQPEYDSASVCIDKDGWHITSQWHSYDEWVPINQGEEVTAGKDGAK